MLQDLWGVFVTACRAGTGFSTKIPKGRISQNTTSQATLAVQLTTGSGCSGWWQPDLGSVHFIFIQGSSNAFLK